MIALIGVEKLQVEIIPSLKRVQATHLGWCFMELIGGLIFFRNEVYLKLWTV